MAKIFLSLAGMTALGLLLEEDNLLNWTGCVHACMRACVLASSSVFYVTL